MYCDQKIANFLRSNRLIYFFIWIINLYNGPVHDIIIIYKIKQGFQKQYKTI